MSRIQALPEVRLVRVDIGNWNSPVAKQFGIRRLPTLWLYEGTQQVSQDTRGVLGQLE